MGRTGLISDGYHTFDELYEHRHNLFAALIKVYGGWKSLYHDDGSSYDGWFIAGINLPTGMITYHIPMAYWDSFPGEELNMAPHWDGHTPNDVINRLKEFWQ
jgi:hypothetical protein